MSADLDSQPSRNSFWSLTARGQLGKDIREHTHRDGVVTRAEFDAIRVQRFRSADKNGDGVLSEDEYVAEFEGRLKRQYFDEGRQPDKAYENSIKQAHVRYGIVNRARDGKFTAAEDAAIADKTFKGLDTNNDGSVSKADPQRPPQARGDSVD